MTVSTTNTASVTTSDFGDPVRRLAAAYRRWRLERRTLSELSALPDRMLEDLGLERSSLAGVARSATDKAV